LLNLPLWLQASAWGGFAGIALLLGSVIGCFLPLKQRTVAGIMAFGSGALISAAAFDLIGEAYDKGGLQAAALGFIAGALIYTAANRILSSYGARHRKRSNISKRLDDSEISGSGAAIAVGALIDGIPESIVIGLGIVAGGSVSLAMVAAVFVSNVPEGLSSSIGMKSSGRSLRFIMSIWTGIALVSAISAGIGCIFYESLPVGAVSAIIAMAAGAILAMIVDTMIPEAFEVTHDHAGFITATGFLCAFIMDRI